MNNRISIEICSKDRHTELSLCLQSLRQQTFQDFDILVLDDASITPIVSAYFVMAMFNRIKLENHKLKVMRRDTSHGVCNARNYLLDNDNFNNKYICRLDDDVIIQPDYLERLMKVIKSGYDIASGVTPAMMEPELERENKFVRPKINKIEIKNGKLTTYKDDCGMAYLEEDTLPANEFRSCAVIKREVFEKVRYRNNLTKVGFREEAFLSLQAQKLGFKIGVDVQAKAYHLMCPSGGVRQKEYSQCVQTDQKTFEEFIKNEIKQEDLK